MNGELAGTVGSGPLSEEFHSTEMGYWLGAAYEGRGVMTKTCAYLITYFFEELKLNRIEIRLSESNTRSRAVPERLGFRLEGNLRKMSYTRDGLTNCLIYSLLADDWQKKTQEDRENMFSTQVDKGLELRLLEARHAEALFGLIDENREHLGYWFPWVEGTKTVEDSRKVHSRGGSRTSPKETVLWRVSGLTVNWLAPSGFTTSRHSSAAPKSVTGLALGMRGAAS